MPALEKKFLEDLKGLKNPEPSIEIFKEIKSEIRKILEENKSMSDKTYMIQDLFATALFKMTQEGNIDEDAFKTALESYTNLYFQCNSVRI